MQDAKDHDAAEEAGSGMINSLLDYSKLFMGWGPLLSSTVG